MSNTANHYDVIIIGGGAMALRPLIIQQKERRKRWFLSNSLSSTNWEVPQAFLGSSAFHIRMNIW
ncbi:hypothetical protein [Flavobacterium sp. 3HN19-14]|uniref:hypothetical protein n=1 Tax=Flavobacterium sp. 3HN19-14 TaxID=3448133 RepID=UPI003EDFF08B